MENLSIIHVLMGKITGETDKLHIKVILGVEPGTFLLRDHGKFLIMEKRNDKFSLPTTYMGILQNHSHNTVKIHHCRLLNK